jgi:transcriptional regulator with XRE-family HTH domain
MANRSVRWVELKRARLAKGMSLRQVQEATGALGCKVDASNLAKAEDGVPGKIGPEKVPVLLKVLGLSIEELIPDEDGKAA